MEKKELVEVFAFHHVHGKMDSRGIRDVLIISETEGYTDDDERLPVQKINGEWCHVLH